jgi:branched-chain amino acid transport system substrate-binding protein
LLVDAPELVVLCCSAVDGALLIQRLRAARPGLPIAASAWSSTGRTLELAGRAADGVVFEQYYDPANRTPAFVRFMQDFEQRFRQPPAFAAVLATDATRLVLAALQRGATRQSMKTELVGASPPGPSIDADPGRQRRHTPSRRAAGRTQRSL